MIVYRGTSTLKDSNEADAIFVTPCRRLAEMMGPQIIIYEIDEAKVFQLNRHLYLINRHPKRDNIQIDSETGLPPSYDLKGNTRSLEALKFMAAEIGFVALMLLEGRHQRSIEVWDTTCLTLLRIEDNLRFTELID